LVKFINFDGTNREYEALILLKVGEFSPIDTNCSVPKLNLFPEVGLTLLSKLFLEVLAIKLTNVFSSGQVPSFGVNPRQIISLIFPEVGVISPYGFLLPSPSIIFTFLKFIPARTLHFASLNGSPPFRGLEKENPPPVFSKTIDEKVSEVEVLVSSTAYIRPLFSLLNSCG